MTTVFTRIMRGEIPGTFVHTDDLCAAFMSINPIRDGHVLVVPRQEVDQWTDMSPGLSSHVFSVSHRISVALRAAFECERVGMMIAGYEIDHCHIHLIPTTSIADFNFANAATSVDRGTLEANAARIIAALAAP
jgi:diadenosine tetraphosphate (Ap4A) HIT family hydrolase